MTQYIELMVTLGFLGALMWGMLKFMLRDIHADLGNIYNEISEIKIDMRDWETKHQKSQERIDHLYQICIEMLKEKK